MTFRERVHSDSHTWIIVLLLLLTATAVMLRQFINPGYYSILDDDTRTYYTWARQFIAALQEGVAYPRWMPEEFWDYGSPTFILYYPLPFYLVALLNLFAGSIVEAMNLAKLLSHFLAGVGIYFLVRKFYPGRYALLAAVFYLVYPFNLLQMYVTGSLATSIAQAWYAPILLALCRFEESRERRHLVYTGLCYGGLLLTHLISAYMFCFVLAAVVTFRSVANKSRRCLLAFPAILTIGGLVSAAYLLPLLWEGKYLRVKALVTGSSGFLYSRPFLSESMINNLPAEPFMRVYYQLYHLEILLLFAITLYSLAWTFKYQRCGEEAERRYLPLTWFLISVSLFTLVLLFEISNWLWEYIPFFNYIQVPARWISITAFTVSLVVPFSFHAHELTLSPRLYRCFVIFIFASLAIIDLRYITRAHRFTEGDLLHKRPAKWPPEHLPAGVDLKRLRQEAALEKASVIAGKGRAEVLEWQSAKRSLSIAAQKPVTVRLRTMNFPGWRAYLDGRPVGTASTSGSQAIMVEVPAGKHRLQLIFEDTAVRMLGKGISLCSLLILAAVLLVDRRRSGGPLVL